MEFKKKKTKRKLRPSLLGLSYQLSLINSPRYLVKITIFLKLFQKTEEKKTPCNSLCEAKINLITKTKDIIRKSNHRPIRI